MLFKTHRIIQNNNTLSNKRKTCKSSLFECGLFNEVQKNTLFKPIINTPCISGMNIDVFEDTFNKNSLSTTNTYASDPHSNYNIYNKAYTKGRKKIKEEELKYFNPFPKCKGIKKENIDRLIIRQFKAFIKDSKDNPQLLRYANIPFWVDFCMKNLLPPFKYQECIGNNIYVEFKSFNSDYYSWLFSKYGAECVFHQFLDAKEDTVIKSLINYINKYHQLNHNEEKDLKIKLKTYLSDLFCSYTYLKKLPVIENCNEPTCICSGNVFNVTIDHLLLSSENNEHKSHNNPLDICHPDFYQDEYHSVQDEKEVDNSLSNKVWNTNFYDKRLLNNNCEEECYQDYRNDTCEKMIFEGCRHEFNEKRNEDCHENRHENSKNNCSIKSQDQPIIVGQNFSCEFSREKMEFKMPENNSNASYEYYNDFNYLHNKRER